MKAGSLNRRVTVEKPTKTADATGQQITSWEPHGTFWARIISGSGTEQMQDNRQVAEDQRWTIELRYNSATVQIEADWRVQFSGKTLSIQSAPDVDDAHVMIRLTALERK